MAIADLRLMILLLVYRCPCSGLFECIVYMCYVKYLKCDEVLSERSRNNCIDNLHLRRLYKYRDVCIDACIHNILECTKRRAKYKNITFFCLQLFEYREREKLCIDKKTIVELREKKCLE